MFVNHTDLALLLSGSILLPILFLVCHFIFIHALSSFIHSMFSEWENNKQYYIARLLYIYSCSQNISGNEYRPFGIVFVENGVWSNPMIS